MSQQSRAHRYAGGVIVEHGLIDADYWYPDWLDRQLDEREAPGPEAVPE